jgi:hypothetical protein
LGNQSHDDAINNDCSSVAVASTDDSCNHKFGPENIHLSSEASTFLVSERGISVEPTKSHTCDSDSQVTGILGDRVSTYLQCRDIFSKPKLGFCSVV